MVQGDYNRSCCFVFCWDSHILWDEREEIKNWRERIKEKRRKIGKRSEEVKKQEIKRFRTS